MIERSVRFDRRLTPSWLRLVCALEGVTPPRLGTRGRYVHIGGGLGATASVVAVLYPDLDVVVVDDDNRLLAVANDVGRAASLDNLTVVRGDLDRMDSIATRLGPVDLFVASEVLCAQTEGGRERLKSLATEVVVPGGLVCFGYRALAGWSDIVPLHRFVRRYTAGPARGMERRIEELMAILDGLLVHGAKYLTQRPNVEGVLDDWLSSQPADLVRLFERPFEPLSPGTVWALMEPAGFDYVGAAQLMDSTMATVPEALRTKLRAIDDPKTRQVVLDLATGQTQRTDVYVRGTRTADSVVAGSDVPVGRSMVDLSIKTLETSTGAVPVSDGAITSACASLEQGARSLAELLEASALRPDDFRSVFEAEAVRPVGSYSVTDAAESIARMERLVDAWHTVGVASIVGMSTTGAQTAHDPEPRRLAEFEGGWIT